MYDFDQDQHENEENSLSSFSANPLTHNNNAPSFVALLVSAVILLVVAVFGTIVLTSNLTKQVKSEDPKKEETTTGFEKLTKEEALKYIRENGNERGTLPKGYISLDLSKYVIIEGRTVKRELALYYSYTNLNELKQDVYKNYYISDNNEPDDLFEVEEFKYYAIITPKVKVGEERCGSVNFKKTCDALISFKKQYVDYHEVVTANSSNEVLLVTTKDKDEINEIARILSLMSSVGRDISSYGHIYDYKFEEYSNKYVLSIDRIYIARQYNEKSLNAGLWQEEYSFDKNDGQMTYKSNFGEYTLEHAFDITKEEYSSLPGYHVD